MQCQLLSFPPISGDFPETSFHAEGRCTWIKFLPEETSPWVGVFGWGSLGFTSEAVAVLQSRPFAFVIAGGAPYIIDYNTQALVWHSHEVHLTRVIAAEAHSLFVVCDDIGLHGYSHDGNVLWDSQRLSWDGIRSLSLVGDTVYGDAEHFDGSVVPFTVDITTGAAAGGSYDGPVAPLSRLDIDILTREHPDRALVRLLLLVVIGAIIYVLF